MTTQKIEYQRRNLSKVRAARLAPKHRVYAATVETADEPEGLARKARKAPAKQSAKKETATTTMRREHPADSSVLPKTVVIEGRDNSFWQSTRETVAQSVRHGIDMLSREIPNIISHGVKKCVLTDHVLTGKSTWDQQKTTDIENQLTAIRSERSKEKSHESNESEAAQFEKMLATASMLSKDIGPCGSKEVVDLECAALLDVEDEDENGEVVFIRRTETIEDEEEEEDDNALTADIGEDASVRFLVEILTLQNESDDDDNAN